MTVRTFDVGDRAQPTGNKPGEAVGTIVEISEITMHDGGRSYRVDFDDGHRERAVVEVVPDPTSQLICSPSTGSSCSPV
jgi:hypothetical protein